MKLNRKFFLGLLFILGLFALVYFLVPQTTHAYTMHEELTYPGTPGVGGNGGTQWVFNVWKVMLGIANVVIVIVLLFLAAINILHLQYDTYQIKKSLPLLIGGAIAANFSILICRMIVDFANVLTATFADSQTVAQGYMCALGLDPTGQAVMLNAMLNPTGAVGMGLIVIIFIVLAVLIAVLIMAFLLWIRKYVIFILTAVSPVAFILYAFPPTQGVFKTWWSWFIKWVFMGPIFMVILWVASEIGNNNCTGGLMPNFSIMFAVIGLTIAAAAIPFKLGGAVMSAWGNLGKKVSGTDKEGYLRKPVDASIQRKKDMAKGALGVAWGNTRAGRWADRGRQREDMLIADYKNQRDTQTARREREIRERNSRFTNNEEELKGAKNRLENTVKGQIGLYVEQNAADIGRDKIDSINAEGDVAKAEARAERLARGEVDSPEAAAQRIREMEVERAKGELELVKGKTEALIRAGAIENLTPAQLQHAFGVGHPGAGTPMDIKDLYLDFDNRVVLLKEELSKRAGQDAQVMAERDLRRNTDLRVDLRDLETAGFSFTSQYDTEGHHNAAGVQMNYHGALAAAEQLRYRATTEADATRRAELETAAQHITEQAQNFRQNNTTYTQAMVDSVAQRYDTTAMNHEADANDATRTAEERALSQQLADEAMENSRRIRAKTGRRIQYDHYLSNNLAGRRQKIINPDIADEIHVQEISNSPRELIAQITDPGGFGTGEARGNQEDMTNLLTGHMDRNSEAGARAAIVQLGAIHSVMKTARHGDAAGLETLDGFNEIMDQAGRGRFKTTSSQRALEAMNPTLRPRMESEIHRQYVEYCNANGITPPANYAAMAPQDIETALTNLNFRHLNLKGQGQDSTSQRDFVDRYLRSIEEDPALQLSSSSGSRLGRARAVGADQFTENRP